MTLQFESIEMDRQKDYLELLRQCNPEASDYSFINLWGWCREYDLSWAWDGDLVWIRQRIPSDMYWAPLGRWESIAWEDRLRRHFDSTASFIRIPERLKNLWEGEFGERLQYEDARGHWDYLYDKTELVELKGNRFHKKKNLLNQFNKKYEFRYLPLDPGVIEKAVSMQEDWCVWRNCESSETLMAENRAITRVLTEWENLEGIRGAALVENEALVAYTVAEQYTQNSLVIHFEKGNTAYKGIYQAINQMFLAHSAEGYDRVNREQDLDDEGLRKAKLSYNPVGFVKKYRIDITIGQ